MLTPMPALPSLDVYRYAYRLVPRLDAILDQCFESFQCRDFETLHTYLKRLDAAVRALRLLDQCDTEMVSYVLHYAGKYNMPMYCNWIHMLRHYMAKEVND